MVGRITTSGFVPVRTRPAPLIIAARPSPKERTPRAGRVSDEEAVIDYLDVRRLSD